VTPPSGKIKRADHHGIPSSRLKNSRYLRPALFRRTLCREILNKATALLPVSLLDPTKNCSLSLTREFFNGLLDARRGLFAFFAVA
jgi:hypothetical protein